VQEDRRLEIASHDIAVIGGESRPVSASQRCADVLVLVRADSK